MLPTLSKRGRWILAALLMLGLVLRVSYALSLPFDPPTVRGGDAAWYLANGAAFYTGETRGIVNGIAFAIDSIPTPPLYLLFAGFWQQFLSLQGAMVAIVLVQSLLGIIVCALAYVITVILSDDTRAGLIAAGALALSPAYVTEAALIQTESLYICWVMSGLAAYLWWWRDEKSIAWLLLSALCLGLATLTRAVALLFPIGIAGHLLLLTARAHLRQRLAWSAMLLLVYSLVVGTWTLHNWLAYDRFVIASDQFTAALWRGASAEDASPERNDELLAGSTAGEQAATIIRSDPHGYLQRRADELIGAYLQPYGTVPFGDESLRALASTWVQSGFSPSALVALLRGEGFVIKALMYIWHYASLLGGVLSLWLWRGRWRWLAVLWGFLLYTTLLHAVFLALPRYIFPTHPVWWCLTAATIVALWQPQNRSDRSATAVNAS